MVQSLIFQYKDLETLYFCAQPGRLPHYKSRQIHHFFVAEVNLRTRKKSIMSMQAIFRQFCTVKRRLWAPDYGLLGDWCFWAPAGDKGGCFKHRWAQLSDVIYRRPRWIVEWQGDYFEETHLIPFIAKNSAILPGTNSTGDCSKKLRFSEQDKEYLDDIRSVDLQNLIHKMPTKTGSLLPFLPSLQERLRA